MSQRVKGGPAQWAWVVWLVSPIGTAIVALGITQIVAWGTTLYALGVLASPIAEDTGWSRSLVFSGLTIGLLASSFVSTAVGKAIDTQGGRLVMSVGSILCAISLLIVAAASNPIVYLAGWAAMGVGMRMSLYDAAFAALVQVAPHRGRRAISYLTLFGGFASTFFWPIGHILTAEVGWRMALVIYAGFNLAVCLPLHWWGLARREPPAPAAAISGAPASAAAGMSDPPLDGQARTLAMVLFGLVMSASAFVFGAMAVHLPAILEANGLSAAAAVTLASFKGVAQVAGRVAEILFGKRLHAIDLGRISVAGMPLAFIALMAGGASTSAALLFIILFGVANGLVTIVRGAVPLAIFGPQGYGAVLGILATPYLLVNAIAPAVLAVVVDLWGYTVAEAVLLAAGLLTAGSMEIMSFWYRRRQKRDDRGAGVQAT
ncbi:MAG TPA: MFS transporter [Hyphomicrobiaceae bacterium]|jgi:predicted MFS family arabinose efflux permease